MNTSTHVRGAAGLRARLDGHDPSARVADLMLDADTRNPVLQAQYVDLHTWLVGDILTKVDRASMANSLEVRAPLLDFAFVEWCGRLPTTLKLRGGEGKHIFRQALEPYLPDQIAHGRKQGFAEPLADQFRRGADRLRERLLQETMLDSGLFEPAAIARMVDEHAAGRFDHSQCLWLLLVFEGFLRQETGASRELQTNRQLETPVH